MIAITTMMCVLQSFQAKGMSAFKIDSLRLEELNDKAVTQRLVPPELYEQRELAIKMYIATGDMKCTCSIPSSEVEAAVKAHNEPIIAAREDRIKKIEKYFYRIEDIRSPYGYYGNFVLTQILGNQLFFRSVDCEDIIVIARNEWKGDLDQGTSITNAASYIGYYGDSKYKTDRGFTESVENWKILDKYILGDSKLPKMKVINNGKSKSTSDEQDYAFDISKATISLRPALTTGVQSKTTPAADAEDDNIAVYESPYKYRIKIDSGKYAVELEFYISYIDSKNPNFGEKIKQYKSDIDVAVNDIISKNVSQDFASDQLPELCKQLRNGINAILTFKAAMSANEVLMIKFIIDK